MQVRLAICGAVAQGANEAVACNSPSLQAVISCTRQAGSRGSIQRAGAVKCLQFMASQLVIQQVCFFDCHCYFFSTGPRNFCMGRAWPCMYAPQSAGHSQLCPGHVLGAACCFQVQLAELGEASRSRQRGFRTHRFAELPPLTTHTHTHTEYVKSGQCIPHSLLPTRQLHQWSPRGVSAIWTWPGSCRRRPQSGRIYVETCVLAGSKVKTTRRDRQVACRREKSVKGLRIWTSRLAT